MKTVTHLYTTRYLSHYIEGILLFHFCSCSYQEHPSLKVLKVLPTDFLQGGKLLDGIRLFLRQLSPQSFAEPQKFLSQTQLQLHFQLPRTHRMIKIQIQSNNILLLSLHWFRTIKSTTPRHPPKSLNF